MKYIIVTVFLFSSFSFNAFAYDSDKLHQEINEKIFKNSVFLNNSLTAIGIDGDVEYDEYPLLFDLLNQERVNLGLEPVPAVAR